jgi:hypothetical protein
MRFMSMVKSNEKCGMPPKELMDAIGKLGEEGFRSGTLVEVGGLAPTDNGARVKVAGGKLSVTDGPFSEAKEVIGGYAVYEVPSREDAIERTRVFMELHRKHWPGWEGEAEIRQIMEQPNFAAQEAKA